MNPSGDMVRVHVNLLPANKGGGERRKSNMLESKLLVCQHCRRLTIKGKMRDSFRLITENHI